MEGGKGEVRWERGGADHTHQTQYFSTYWYIHDLVTVVTIVPYRNVSVPDIYHRCHFNVWIKKNRERIGFTQSACALASALQGEMVG